MGVIKDTFDELKDTINFGYEEGGLKDCVDIVKSIFNKKE